jgi:hypothetical protein
MACVPTVAVTPLAFVALTLVFSMSKTAALTAKRPPIRSHFVPSSMLRVSSGSKSLLVVAIAVSVLSPLAKPEGVAAVA